MLVLICDGYIVIVHTSDHGNVANRGLLSLGVDDEGVRDGTVKLAVGDRRHGNGLASRNIVNFGVLKNVSGKHGIPQ